ncbi:MAG: hypothetical protein WBC83_01585 [Minisyncoccia bacterium]
MKFTLGGTVEHILVLGAGASVEYGLPTWKELSVLIKEKIIKDTENRYQHKKEMLAWVDKVGDTSDKYTTIDECIFKESIKKEYHSNGYEIEKQIFLVIRDIFSEEYTEYDQGWIRVFNDKVLSDPKESLENNIAFINYNYDDVLDKNIINFSYLPQKHQQGNYKERLNALSGAVVNILYPHGNLFSRQEAEYDSRIARHVDTMKTDYSECLDAVSCHDSKSHVVSSYTKKLGVKLYILGLGGGLEVNLNKLGFTYLNKVFEIHVTINDVSRKEEIIKFLSDKYEIPPGEIRVYVDCKELVEKCFNN